jgi:hypothetical protein
MLCALLNIPQLPTSFSVYNKTVGSPVADVSVSFMMHATRGAVAENEEADPSHITACFDGAWQKGGYTSLNGIMSATSANRGKVLGIEIMSQSCFVWHTHPTSQRECKKNHEGARSGKEGAGLHKICNHSLHTGGVCYTKYLGDGDSKSYQRVVGGKPYDPNIGVTKFECIGHVQKRTEGRLRRFVKEKRGTKLHDSKPVEGKGHLTQSEIDKLQNCYGLAIRRNVNYLEVMKRAV